MSNDPKTDEGGEVLIPWNVVMHVCPSCGAIFTSPSVCMTDGTETVTKRYMSCEQVIAKLSRLDPEYPNLSDQNEPWVRLLDVLAVVE
jgi:hypothetical protein